MYSKNLTHAYQSFRPVLELAQILPRSALSRLRWLTGLALLLSIVLVIVTTTILPDYYHQAQLGMLFIFAGLYLEQIALYCYHNWYYFRGLDSIIGSAGKQPAAMTYEVAAIIHSQPQDLTTACFRSTLGSQIAMRLGIDSTTLNTFLEQPRATIAADTIALPIDQTFTLTHLITALLQYDTALTNWLKQQGIQLEHIPGAVQFVLQPYYAAKRKERWWSRDQLSMVGGFGRSLAYGTPYELERFSQSITNHTVYHNKAATAVSARPYITEVEQTLARSRAANVLLIGEPGVGKLDILNAVVYRLEKSYALNSLSDLRLIMLDTERLLAHTPDRAALESELIEILNQAADAGNVAIVIDNISHFINEAAKLGVAVPELLDEFLALPTLHIIGTGTPADYHHHLSTLGGFVRRFHEIIVAVSSVETTVNLLQTLALTYETKQPIIFTYQSIVTIADTADRYLTEGVMPDKAITLLEQVADYAKSEGVVTITPDTVHTCIQNITGLPVGPVQANEREGLLHLEEQLQTRVVGQTAAISAIAKTIRRARVDITRRNKPIGSFLFLGPTGVGKTETAKVLAASFADQTAAFVRFDMSEFSNEEGLAQLLGTGNQPGMLATQLQEHPYSVMLLDEFEKAHQSVRDLFLQILDEGVFTNARGEKVNARNTIIIATSNAGSDLIIRTVAARQSLRTLEHDIIAVSYTHLTLPTILRV